MTDYYTNVCFELPVDKTHLDYCKLLNTAISVLCFEGVEPKDLPEEVRDAAVAIWTNHDQPPGIDIVSDGDRVIIFSDESCHVEATAEFVMYVLEHAHSDEIVEIRWAHTASREVVDAYGGGVCLVNRAYIEYQPQWDWLDMARGAMKESIILGRPPVTWATKELLGEIAAILVRLENGKNDDALYMAGQIVGDTTYHARAFEEYEELNKEEFDGEPNY